MLYPMFALVVFIFLFVCYHFYLRVVSVRNKQVRISYFRLFEADGADIPKHILAGSRHIANVFETPVLFFVVSLLAIVLQQESPLMVSMGWAYVVVRIVHALIHTTYNNILHRLLVFWMGMLLLMAMWGLLVCSV
ncbi:MAPEG family protein [Teredinibacter haidensis]|uniref:MAPEG family protein n=1 Tax=Teredinibacter haidensis TaxID=2731755 RepID=UPI000948AB6B|nr:MAPEG family protein [Teredinibacter haidensis]